MRIVSFRIENFRNLRLAECSDVPDFMVICGGNGCGKSALLEALMTAKERAGAYGNFSFDPRAVSADATKATIAMVLAFGEEERSFVKQHFNVECAETDEITVEIHKGGQGSTQKSSQAARSLLGYYSRGGGAPGFFDYINAERQSRKSALQSWDASYLSDDRAKKTLARAENKFELTKQYLAALKMGDLQHLQTSLLAGHLSHMDSLKEIRDFFDSFFAPMSFRDVFIERSPFGFVVSTPQGDIDIDDLSSGEKEILNVFVRFHHLKPTGAVILLDEADVHLHPDLERRYLQLLRRLGEGTQLFLTTHSPEMMIAAGTECLYTILKQPPREGVNQLVRVTTTQQRHEALSELMGSRGIVSFNQRIVFIEGEDASADRAVYEAVYPPAKYNISFVPAGNSSTVRKTCERVNHVLTSSTGFQHYFSIVDKDVERFESDPSEGRRLFRLPVYHVENVLLDDRLILEATRNMVGAACPYGAPEQVGAALRDLVLSDNHLNSYAGSLWDAQLAKAAKAAYDAVYTRKPVPPVTLDFTEVRQDAESRLRKALDDDTWRAECKGRDLLKCYCGKHGLNYEHFRNVLISSIKEPPQAIAAIVDRILQT